MSFYFTIIFEKTTQGRVHMSNQSNYKKQQNLSLVQFLAELPAFVALLLSAIFSRTILIFVDLLDSLGNVLRAAMISLLSKKLTKDLRYEYNYGIGKIEAICALFCDGIVFFGLLLTLVMSVYSIVFPDRPSDLVIAVVGLKVINVGFDVVFFTKQREILKNNRNAIAKTNFAAALAGLLFDSITLVSLFAMWLLRNNPIGGYISPVISIFVAVYLMIGCIHRTKASLNELTDKTLPEETQMKILNILVRFYKSYEQVHSVKSHKIGESLQIDLHLSFEKSTTFEEILLFEKQIQAEFDKQIGHCSLNIMIAGD